MTRRLSPREKLERKPAIRACTFCHSKHLQCSNTRPCVNCVKRKIEHECKDVVRKRASYLLPKGEKKAKTGRNPSVSQESPVPRDISIGGNSPLAREISVAASDRERTATASETSMNSTSAECFTDSSIAETRPAVRNFVPQISYTSAGETFPDQAGQTYPAQTSESFPDQTGKSFHEPARDTPSSSTPSTTANFNSMFLNQEYMMLGDLISKPTSPSLGFAPTVPGPMMTPEFFNGLEGDGDFHDTRPYISLGDGEGKSARENGFNFDLRAGDEHEYVSPLLSHHIYQTVQDIYSNRIINFDYPSSYHSLTHFLKSRFSVTGKFTTPEEKSRKRNNLLVILKLIASYRPTFISAHKSLFQPFDFQFLEMSFQRCLLDFENLSRLNASPMIIWRRTGEIVSMSAHLADILGMNISDVLSKRTFIMELMYDDESIVEYFRLFKSVAIGSLHSTIFTKCKLIKKPSHNRLSTSKTNARLADVGFIEFCSVWTVKRDLFDLPMMIVGHFLPSLPNNDTIRSY